MAKGISSAVTADSPDADVALFVPYVFIETAMESVDGKIQIGAEVCFLYLYIAGPLLYNQVLLRTNQNEKEKDTSGTSFDSSFEVSRTISHIVWAFFCWVFQIRFVL